MATSRWDLRKVDKMWRLRYDHGVAYFHHRSSAVRFAYKMAEKVYGPRGIRS